MRLLYSLALAALVSSGASAQTQYADSSGGFVALHQLSFGSGGTRSVDATVGRRLGGGFDAGLRLGYSDYGVGSGISGGPVVGITRPVGRGFVGRIEGAVRYASSSTVIRSSSPFGGEPYALRSLSEDVTATIARPVRIVGSLRLRPTLGLYASAGQRLTLEAPERFQGSPTARSAGGVHIELPLTFRLFGQDAAFSAVGRVRLVGDPLNGPTSVEPAYAGGGLRLNF